MSSNTLPPSFKVCATCALWAGGRSTDSLRNSSIFEMDQTGECCGAIKLCVAETELVFNTGAGRGHFIASVAGMVRR